MKKTGILNKDISELIASMGHFDTITVCDAGLPIPDEVWRIDLAVRSGMPELLSVLKAVADDLEVQQIILAEELPENNQELDQSIRTIFSTAEVIYVPHKEFKARSHESKAIIRTGECTPYANVILVSGVTF